MRTKSVVRLLTTTLAVIFPGTLLAQTSTVDAGTNPTAADTAPTDIVVTGSRIARPDLQQSSPISVISAKELALTGQINIEGVLKDLPQLIPSTTGASNNPGGGVATADLRGLGATRTLVLVDGRRYVSYDSNQIVDLNTIPTGLIERVDIVSGGRSAVYGSDTISGVVNFVMKKDFSGIEANANYRITGAGDGGTANAHLLLGHNFDSGRGNVTLYLDYTKRDAILQNDRSYSRQALVDDGSGGLIAGGSGSIEGTRFALGGVSRKFGTDGSYSAYNSRTDAYNYARPRCRARCGYWRASGCCTSCCGSRCSARRSR
ncbi:outer membrane receptor protein involved in Fe transport [Sphingomonas sp. UYP23]